MKRIAILGVFLLLGAATLTQAQGRKAAREARRQQQQQQQQVHNAGNFQTAMQALKDSSFVIEVNQIQGQYGKVVYVTANDNFVALNKNTSTVPLAFNNGVPGLNGAGGVTLSGTISDLKIRTDKHGNVTYQYQLQGNSISSTVIITLFNGDNKVSVVLNSTYSNSRLTFFGRLYPTSQSDVYKAQPNILIPWGLVN